MRLYKSNFARFLLGFCITLLFLPGLPFSRNLTQTNHDQQLFIPKNSGYVVSPIIINGNSGWFPLASSEPWCYVSSLEGNPYIIENITIDAQGIDNCIEIIGSTLNFIIRNCTFLNSGTRSGFGGDAGIRLESVNNGKIINCRITNNGNDGIFMRFCHNIVINNNTLSNNDQYGLHSGDYNTNTDSSFDISNNIFENNYMDDVHMGWAWYVNFSSNYFFSGAGIQFSGFIKFFNNTFNNANLKIEYSEHNEIIQSIFKNCGITVRSGSDYNSIINCSINYQYPGINIYGHDTPTSNINIQNTKVSCSTDHYCIFILNGVSAVNISNTEMNGLWGLWLNQDTLSRMTSHSIENTTKINGKNVYYYSSLSGLGEYDFTNAGQVFLANCTNSVISNVNVSNSGVGISMFYCTNNTIKNSLSEQTIPTHTSTYPYGINMYYCNNNTILNNQVKNGLYGISFRENSDFNKIINNTVQKSDYGMRIASDCDNNTILNNLFKDNDDGGLSLNSDTHDNLVYLNTFINNDPQASDSGINNSWDNGSIGNYWDNYNGKDLNDDGIGDIPHNIYGSAGSIDSFPIWRDPLVISIISPVEQEVFREAPAFNISIADGIVNTTSYSIDNGLMYIKCNLTGIVDQTLWNAKLDGVVNLTFFTNDTSGMITNRSITVIKDTTSPLVNILSPHDLVVFTENPPVFYLSINDANMESTWYRNNIILVNISFSGSAVNLAQEVWDSLPEGEISFTFYARDVVGNIGMTSVIIIKESSSGSLEQAIPGYNLFLLFSFISIGVILIKERKRKKEG